MKITGKQIIGADLEISDERTFDAINPKNGERLMPSIYEGTEADVDKAAKLVKRDFDALRTTSNENRAKFLETIAEEILALGDILIKRTTEETALPEARLTGERVRTINQLKLFAQLAREGSWVEARIDTAIPDREPIPRPDVRSMHIAIGPVAVFGASNFPLAFSVAGGDTAPALAAGCPVIVKGHPAHPGTCELVGLAIQAAVKKCNMPEGTFSLVQGSGNTVGEALVKHPAIKAVGFTGSFRGGKALFDLAASRPEPIPVYAEMGSTNPVFILPKALKERGKAIAAGLADSTTLGVGQFCTNPGLVLAVKSAEYELFVEATSRAMAEKSPATMLHAGIKSAYEAGITELTSIPDVQLVAEANSSASARACDGVPRLLRSSAQMLLTNPRLEEEVFGPSSLIVACESKAEMLQVAEDLHGHLTATIHGTEDELTDYRDLIEVLENKVGRIIFNGFPTGVEVCHSMNHGGPFPATTDSRSTSVGTAAIKRFLRPVCYQNFPQAMLPEPLRDRNSLEIWRLVNGEFTKADIST